MKWKLGYFLFFNISFGFGGLGLWRPEFAERSEEWRKVDLKIIDTSKLADIKLLKAAFEFKKNKNIN